MLYGFGKSVLMLVFDHGAFGFLTYCRLLALVIGYTRPRRMMSACEKMNRLGSSIALRTNSTGPPNSVCGLVKMPDPPRNTVLPDWSAVQANPKRGPKFR